MNVWKSLAGMMAVEIICADEANSFKAINQNRIAIYEVSQKDELTYHFLIARKDYTRLASLVEKHGDRLVLQKQLGIYWFFQKILRRPALLAGILALFIFILLIPTRVFFIQVEGNQIIPEKKIVEAAQACGIRFGAVRKEVRSEKMKNALLSQIPDLQWAGINTRGCVAVISVREKEGMQNENAVPEEKGVCSIVASRNGVISSCIVTKGNQLVQIGQAVEKGQVLISGYTDCGICIQATQAQGEVFADTMRNITVVTPMEFQKIASRSGEKTNYSLLIGKKRIKLWFGSGIWEGSCGKIYKEYALILPGGFRLPLALCVEQLYRYETEAEAAELSDLQEPVAMYSESYLHQPMIAGTILKKNETFFQDNNCARMQGVYICREMIGSRRWEKMGE